MALSRAAAAAARKAAKNRGLRGNRAEDGSLIRASDEFLDGDPKYTVGADTDQLNFYEGLAEEMSNAKLLDEIGKAGDEVDKLTAVGAELNLKERSPKVEKYHKEMSTAKQKLKAYEDELALRSEARAEQALADNDMNAMEFERYVDFEDV